MLIAACGQRGPLYLPAPPAEPAPRVRTPSSGTVIVPPAGASTGTAARPQPDPAATDPQRPARRAD